jgi:hypothetical protein
MNTRTDTTRRRLGCATIALAVSAALFGLAAYALWPAQTPRYGFLKKAVVQSAWQLVKTPVAGELTQTTWALNRAYEEVFQEARLQLRADGWTPTLVAPSGTSFKKGDANLHLAELPSEVGKPGRTLVLIDTPATWRDRARHWLSSLRGRNLGP